jgi:hypothetical protein
MTTANFSAKLSNELNNELGYLHPGKESISEV